MMMCLLVNKEEGCSDLVFSEKEAADMLKNEYKFDGTEIYREDYRGNLVRVKSHVVDFWYNNKVIPLHELEKGDRFISVSSETVLIYEDGCRAYTEQGHNEYVFSKGSTLVRKLDREEK